MPELTGFQQRMFSVTVPSDQITATIQGGATDKASYRRALRSKHWNGLHLDSEPGHQP